MPRSILRRRFSSLFLAMKGVKPSNRTVKPDDKLGAKRKGADKVSRQVKRAKAGKDPNAPKRPPTAFFIFMDDFRKEFKEKNPNNKSVAIVSKAGGDKWKSMSDAEKAPYQAKSEKRKTEYNLKMDAYNKKLGGDAEGEESDKSKSEVHDEEDEEGSGENGGDEADA